MDKIKAFIIPRSRTGGTLFATMLDAHPDMSFGYETYPDKLCGESGEGYSIATLINILEECRNDDPVQWVKKIEEKNFRTFCARARRSGLEAETILKELISFQEKGADFGTEDSRLNFIDRIIDLKRQEAGKLYTGSKMLVDPYVLHKRHPEASYYMMVRDGRDVLDSRMNTGNFNQSVEFCAHDWKDSINGFQRFINETQAKGCLIKYESLVYEPKKTIEKALIHADLAYSPAMVSYMNNKPTLLDAPHGHLSANRIAEGLNDKTIGRWKNSIHPEKIDAFISICGDVMAKYGYM